MYCGGRGGCGRRWVPILALVLLGGCCCRVGEGSAAQASGRRERLEEEEEREKAASAAARGRLEDDGGFEAVGRALLRQPPPAGAEDDEASELSERAFRTVVSQRLRAARASHKVAREFMKRFSRNLKLSVLEDSKGDMPEAERLRAMRVLREGQDFHFDEQSGSGKTAVPSRNTLQLAQQQQQLRHPMEGRPSFHRDSRRHHGMRMLNALPADPASPPLPELATARPFQEEDPQESDSAAPPLEQLDYLGPSAILAGLRNRPQRRLVAPEAMPEAEYGDDGVRGGDLVGHSLYEDDGRRSPSPRGFGLFGAPARGRRPPPPPPLLFAEGSAVEPGRFDPDDQRLDRDLGRNGAPRHSSAPLLFVGSTALVLLAMGAAASSA